MPQEPKPSRGFAARIMTLQFVVVGLMILAAAAGAMWVTVERVNEQAQERALAIARTLAADPEIRAQVQRYADADTLDAAALRTGYVQQAAEGVRARTGAFFVVVTEDRGIRLAHPTPSLLGQKVSTDPVALSGHESVSREHGTLGESVRAKVPVFAPGDATVVGEVSVGVGVQELAARLRTAGAWVLGLGLGALALSAASTRWLVRRLKAQTLGLEPAEMAQLLRDRDAVLYGVADGVIGIGPDGRVSVRNKAARIMLGLPHRHESSDIIGQPYTDARLPAPLVAAIAEGTGATLRLETEHAALVATVHPVAREGIDLGQVVLLRDVTTIETLGSRLDAVQTMAGALRAQRHEFANRLHTISGLLHHGDVAEARDYLGEVIASGPVREPVQNLAAIEDTYLRAFLGAKGVEAYERGVVLRVGDASALYGSLIDAQDATAVLGNLIDNALRAAVQGPAPRWVEVDLLSEGATLHLAVADSGDGVPAGLDVFAEGVSTGALPDAPEHGQGVGLPLVRRLARTRGGEVWIADPGGPGNTENAHSGAVFAARLPGVLSTDVGTTEGKNTR
ncbi:sensor histidine kinase [Paeniglutamicibacter psychrophenolicus]|uniref:histidine kinase n=1 Tax=Paeniglutamicibacter psychrophenolicus TaxID=257454 RepID=A0ABS4W865_9MICC|nr:ATP-binding protein [Paeniglutamicibacter psychrophenolicus]MBP2372303.1 two-component system CitB family sensor kinase [Paeniglutamicibacter psychrophenolicus]